MKKLFIIIICFSLAGCFNSQTSVQDEYYEYLKVLEKADNYANGNIPVDIIVTKESSDLKKNHYSIIIDNPKFKMDKLKIIAYPIGYKNDEIVPNFNILEKVDTSAFFSKEAGIKLNYFSDNEYEEFKILLSYHYDDSNHEDIYLLKVNFKAQTN